MLTRSELDELAVLQALHEGPAALAGYLDMAYLPVDHQRLIGRAIADAWRSHGREWLMINTPPQVGKTVTSIEWGAFWILATDPTARIILVSYNDTYAVQRGSNVRKLIDEYGERFGLFLASGSSGKKDWQITRGGALFSTGLGGGITGRDATAILVDDYIKSRPEADSPVVRARTLAEMTTSVLTRRAPSCFVCLVGTLWHPLEASQVLLDMYGRVEDGGQWRRLRLPAYADSPDDPLGRAIGDPLLRVDQREGRVLTQPEALEWWQAQERGNNPRDFSALYQAKPVYTDDPSITPEQIDAAYGVPGDITYSVLAVDPSDADTLEATRNDRTGIVHVGRDADNKVWILDDYSISGPIEKWAPRVAQLADVLNVDKIVYERNKAGRATGQVLKSALANVYRTRMPPIVKDVTATTNKVTRASPVIQHIISGACGFSRKSVTGLSTIANQLMTYQLGSSTSPDEMDAMVWGVTELYVAPRPLVHRRGKAQWELYD